MKTAGSSGSLWLVLLVCALAPAAATLLFVLHPRLDTTAAGELVGPVALPAGLLAGTGDSAARVWRLVAVGPAPCGPACASRLCVLRQARLAHLPERSRIARMWLVTAGTVDGPPVYSDPSCKLALDSGPAGAGPVEVLGGVSLVAATPAELSFLPEPAGALAAEDYVYVVDPQGSLIMRHAGLTAAKDLAADLGRLLRLSRSAP